MHLKFAFLAIATLISSAYGGSDSGTLFEQACARIAARHGHDTERLHELFRLDWEYNMREQPELATLVGFPGQDDRWQDFSVQAIERRKREAHAPLKAIKSINRARLSEIDALSYDLFQKRAEEAIEGSRFKNEYLLVNQMSGPQQSVAEILDQAPRAKVHDYENMIARLRGVPALLDQTTALLSAGLAAGITPPRVTLRDVPDQVKSQMESDPSRNPILTAFFSFPSDFSESDKSRLRDEAAKTLSGSVIPAFTRFHEFLVEKYIPGARESIGCSALPDGKEWYAYNVRTSTTTSMTPQQIHELGISEVKRIRGEMDKLIEQTGFKGSFADFCEFLRTDPRFYYTNADSLVSAYRDIVKRADPQLAHLFGKLPRLPYGVKVVPSYAEKSQTTAYYQQGSPQVGRPGWYFVNTYALNMRPKWEMEALSLHESVPGHHLQIALAQEMEDMPEFRKNAGYTAYVEGWGLYSESLGTEMGFYTDPYMKFGQLTYEMWRAVRLVVDTGMHSMGWSRQQAIDYFMSNASKTEQDVIVEIDRYIVWPGQALAYKIGELKLKELRAYAARELGPAFDIRAFHDQVLDSGPLPLEILEKRIKAWVLLNKGPGRRKAEGVKE
jgi:uncharacterized protein (DUF885 family)